MNVLENSQFIFVSTFIQIFQSLVCFGIFPFEFEAICELSIYFQIEWHNWLKTIYITKQNAFNRSRIPIYPSMERNICASSFEKSKYNLLFFYSNNFTNDNSVLHFVLHEFMDFYVIQRIHGLEQLWRFGGKTSIANIVYLINSKIRRDSFFSFTSLASAWVCGIPLVIWIWYGISLVTLQILRIAYKIK